MKVPGRVSNNGFTLKAFRMRVDPRTGVALNTSNSSSTSSPKRKWRKRLRQRLRETKLDEGDDIRQRLREVEDKNVRLKEKLDIKKRAILALKKSHQEEISGLNTSHKKRVAETQAEIANVKSKLEKKVKSLTKQIEKAEMNLMKEKSIKTSGDNDAALLQDIFANLKEFMEGQLQCAICSEIFVFPAVISCGHSFCDECIHGWRQKKQGSCSCPICRADIILVSPNQALESFIEKFVENYFPEEAKRARADLLKERTKLKEAREPEPEAANQSILSAGTRHRILFNHADSDSDDDSWGGFQFAESPPNSPGALSNISEASLASTRSLLSEGFVSTPNGSDIGSPSDHFVSDDSEEEEDESHVIIESSPRSVNEDDEEDSNNFSRDEEESEEVSDEGDDDQSEDEEDEEEGDEDDAHEAWGGATFSDDSD